jgi:hypothetical protein
MRRVDAAEGIATPNVSCRLAHPEGVAMAPATATMPPARTQDGREPLRPLGPHGDEPAEVFVPLFLAQRPLEEEHDGARGLVLARRAEPPVGRQVGEERPNVGSVQLTRVPPPVAVAAEPEEVGDPRAVASDCARGQVPHLRRPEELVEYPHLSLTYSRISGNQYAAKLVDK